LSFSAATRDELARVVGRRPCCLVAELSALVKINGSMQISGSKLGLTVTAGSAAVARKVLKLVKINSSLATQVLVKHVKFLRRGNVYVVNIPPQSGVEEFLQLLGLMSPAGVLEGGVPAAVSRRECCRRSYLRGVFLGGGSVSSPAGDYHLELVAGGEEYALSLAGLLGKCRIGAGVSRRKGRFVVYLKGSEQIGKFLNLIGAHAALLKFEDARVLKDVRNRVNRLVNCETANLNKTVDAAVRQLENVCLIRDTIGLEKMPKPLREAALLRIKYPDASLKEIGEMMKPRLGKSGVSHRFRKIEEMAAKIKDGGFKK